MNRFFVVLVLAACSIALTAGCASQEEGNETPAEPVPADEPAVEDTSPADLERFPDVVAKVNGVEISKRDLMDRATEIRSQIPPTEDSASKAYFERVLDDVVGSELLYQASHEAGLNADAAEVDSQLEMLRSRFPDPTMFEQALSQQGMTADGLKARIGRDLTIQKFVETRVNQEIAIEPAAARAFYDGNPDQMRQPDKLRLSHILKRVEPDTAPEDKQATREVMDGLLAEARGSADFAALAREHSEDPGSAGNGGELTVSRGETVPPFEQAAFALEPGGVSDVVETQFGFHIIRLSEKISGEPVPFEQAKPRIEMFLKQQALQEALGTKVEALKDEASVELFL